MDDHNKQEQVDDELRKQIEVDITSVPYCIPYKDISKQVPTISDRRTISIYCQTDLLTQQQGLHYNKHLALNSQVGTKVRGILVA